ncbi:hypothetical protein [Pectobacterium polaris]|uniref:hypothetical protein n=1 Tax=Pectobacterium polaris TaxID=2042057 RepID=UPI0015834B84|nr:hypothetical protein [Pectobacterium polaris]
MKSKIVLILVMVLSGCDNNKDFFGFKLGQSVDSVITEKMIKKKEVISSKKDLVFIDLNSVPSPYKTDGRYFIQAVDGKIVSVNATFFDESSFSEMVTQAERLLGKPIASNYGVIDDKAVGDSIFGCVKKKDCPSDEYFVYRKDNVNALIGKTITGVSVNYTIDEIKKSF